MGVRASMKMESNGSVRASRELQWRWRGMGVRPSRASMEMVNGNESFKSFNGDSMERNGDGEWCFERER